MATNSDLRRRDLTPEMKDGQGIERFRMVTKPYLIGTYVAPVADPDSDWIRYRPEYEDVERLRQAHATSSELAANTMAANEQLVAKVEALEQENARLRDVSDSYRVGLAEAEAKLAALRDKVDETLAALEGTTMEIDAAKKLQKLSQHLAEAR
jgi:chromosome segregation ATPase